MDKTILTVLILLNSLILLSLILYAISSWIVLKNTKANRRRKLKWIKRNKKRKHPKIRSW